MKYIKLNAYKLFDLGETNRQENIPDLQNITFKDMSVRKFDFKSRHKSMNSMHDHKFLFKTVE